MNKINRKLEYALMALKHMSQKASGDLTSAKEVSESFQTPFDATARVMQQMASKGGILKSEYGVNGGYQISKELSQVSIHDLLQLVEGPMAIVKCLHQEEPCQMKRTCNIVSPLTLLNERLTDFYQSLSLQELLMDKTNMQENSPEVNHGQ